MHRITSKQLSSLRKEARRKGGASLAIRFKSASSQYSNDEATIYGGID